MNTPFRFSIFHFRWILGIALLLGCEVLGQDWERALAPKVWSFPADHGAHPEYKTEWWYLTGNLQTEDRRHFGYQLTFFRHGVSRQATTEIPELGNPVTESEWRLRDVHFAHFALTDVKTGKFLFFERVARPILKRAGADVGQLNVWNGNWFLRQPQESELTPAQGLFPFECEFGASEGDVSIQLRARAVKPLVLQGEEGLSAKSTEPGNASHYYSYSRMQTEGAVSVGGESFSVSGNSWFDREFSTSALAEDQAGWDWFSLHLDDGSDIMIYLMRNKDGTLGSVSEATHIDSLGIVRKVGKEAFQVTATGRWQSPHNKAWYPSGWKIQLPSLGYQLKVLPFVKDQELNLQDLGTLAYWEGACVIEGTAQGRPILGTGYTELTGYGSSLGRGMKE